MLLGFERGGAYPVVFPAFRDAHAGWVTWRRAPLAPVGAAPRRSWAARGDGKPAEVLLADETVTIKDYGQARQITLFEDGAPVLQVLTSDTDAPAAALLAGCAAGGGTRTCSNTRKPTTASTGCATTTPGRKTITT